MKMTLAERGYPASYILFKSVACVILTMRGSFPVFLGKRTRSKPVGTSHLCHEPSFGSRNERHSRVYVLQCQPLWTEGEVHANPTAGSSCGCTSSDRVWLACIAGPLRRSQAEGCGLLGTGASGCRGAVQSHEGRCGCA